MKTFISKADSEQSISSAASGCSGSSRPSWGELMAGVIERTACFGYDNLTNLVGARSSALQYGPQI